jgi:Putative zinc-binding metallo-peptidase
MQSVETSTDAEQQESLSRRISELRLKMEGTRLEELTIGLYKELGAAGIAFKPDIYLSDSWGCPNEVPVIGVPFYLADPALGNLLGQMSGIEVENDVTVMMILRHEAGHAFNYAYRLYDKPEWKTLFGQFSQPYQEDYQVDPSSTRFVRHLEGCYAQKHPDEDFAETFAVWLTPYSDWRTAYAGTPALEKLQYVESVRAEYGDKPPIVTGGRVDTPVEEIGMTLREWYEAVYKNRINQAQLTQIMRPGASECPQVTAREAVATGCHNYSPA